jgi:hypothetical protein
LWNFMNIIPLMGFPVWHSEHSRNQQRHHDYSDQQVSRHQSWNSVRWLILADRQPSQRTLLLAKCKITTRRT